MSLCYSCQDVIELDLNDADPKLVIDAFIELNEDGSTTTLVKLTRSAPFNQETVTTVNNATVRIIDGNGIAYQLTNEANEFYTTTLLNVEENLDYTLEIIDNGEVYTATEQLVKTVPIVDVLEEEITGFGEITQITAFYDDPAGLDNYYLFTYQDDNNLQTDIGDDVFFDGNRAPTIFFLENLEPQTPSVITIRGINENAFRFFENLLQQAGEGGPGGGPFGTPPATVRGNIVNATNVSNFPFGYFRVSQVFKTDYISL